MKLRRLSRVTELKHHQQQWQQQQYQQLACAAGSYNLYAVETQPIDQLS